MPKFQLGEGYNDYLVLEKDAAVLFSFLPKCYSCQNEKNVNMELSVCLEDSHYLLPSYPSPVALRVQQKTW